jgi:hypothetical protein
MVLKTLLFILVISVLMEDSASIKKTTEEVKEDEEVAKAVNRTLAEEERKRKEEEDEAEKKKRKDKARTEKEDKDEKKDVEDKDEACPPVNTSCPIVKPYPPCPKVKECQQCETCKECPAPVGCPPCEECGPCPDVTPCQPCQPCSSNDTSVQPPSGPGCPEPASMPTVVAVAVGAVASLLVTGVAAAISLLQRYASPMVYGFIFLATIIIVWYLSSQYPETARELGGRAATLLREAAMALSHRVAEAIRHHDNQVGFSLIITSLD